MNQHSILAAVVDDRGFQALGLLASWATLLLGSAWLTASLLRRASSAVRYCVWQYALVALLAAPAAFSLLPGIPLGISLTATGPPSSGSRRWGDSPSDLRPRLTDELPNGPIRESQAEHVPPRGGIPQVTTENRGNAATIANSANDAQSALVAWSTATVGGWVLGVAAQLGWLLWCMARASRLVRAAQTVDDARIRRLTHELDVRFAPGRQVRLM
ncbi:MAG TPA: hypothetical protein VJ783_09355, partial [Pirellulales bacterium]|nr:hypothetical protein [Pirellulales bacterium]